MKTDSLEFQKVFFNLISPINQISVIHGDIEIKTKPEILEKSKEFGFEVEDLGEKTRILMKSLPFVFFKSKEEFNSKFHFKDSDDILLIESEQVYSKIGEKVYINFEESESFIFKNPISYKNFISFLKSKESEDDNGFQFTDSMNLDFCRIILISESGTSRLRIKYNETLPDLDVKIDYSISLNKFIDCFKGTDKYFPRFLKTALIEFGNNLIESDRLKGIFEGLEKIIKKAEINFQVYINELSIEKIKKDYDELKSKYFKELSETLGKITQKIIALPIGISASLVAIERIKDNTQFLIFLLIIIFSTSILISFLINSNLKDLVYLKKIFSMEYNQFKGNGFFTKFPEELDLFNEIKDKFVNRVRFYFNLSNVFFWVMNLGNSYLILYILSNFEIITIGGIYFISIVLISLLIYFFTKMEKNKTFA